MKRNSQSVGGRALVSKFIPLLIRNDLNEGRFSANAKVRRNGTIWEHGNSKLRVPGRTWSERGGRWFFTHCQPIHGRW